MHTLFDIDETFTKRKYSSPLLERLLRQQQTSIELAIDYYRVFGKAVNGSHPIAKLIYSFTFPAEDNNEAIFAGASDNRYELASAVGITTSVNKKEPINSIFYPECNEYLVADNRLSFRDVLYLKGDDWMDLSPIRVIYQPYRLLAHHYPVGGTKGDNFAVLGIDIPMLAVMYTNWQRNNRLRPEDMREGVEHFVGRYVLPNMLYSQADTILLNIIGNLVNNNKQDLYKFRPAFHITTYEDSIEGAVEKLSKKIDVATLKPMDFLAMFPNAKMDGTLLDTYPTIHAADTLANYTVRFIAAIGYVDNALAWLEDSAFLTPMANRLNRIIRNVNNRGTIRGISNSNVRYLIDDMYKRIQLILHT